MCGQGTVGGAELAIETVASMAGSIEYSWAESNQRCALGWVQGFAESLQYPQKSVLR